MLKIFTLKALVFYMTLCITHTCIGISKTCIMVKRAAQRVWWPSIRASNSESRGSGLDPKWQGVVSLRRIFFFLIGLTSLSRLLQLI